MRYIITLFLLCGVAYGQSWIPMSSNYKYRGLKADSILGIPRFSDTLSPQKANGYMILVDSIIYTYYNKWSPVGSVLTDTTFLSNRINLKLNISDTSNMLSKYLRKIDTASLSNRINLKIDSLKKSGDTIYFKKNSVWYFAYRDSSGSGTTTDTTSLSNRINTKLNTSDTATMLSPYAKSNLFGTKLNITDTSAMLSPYLRSNSAANTYLSKSDSTTYQTKYRSDTARTNIYAAINTKLNTSDSTIYYTKYRSDTARTNIYLGINSKLNISDTAAMLSPYLKKVDTVSISSRINNIDLQSVTDQGDHTNNDIYVNTLNLYDAPNDSYSNISFTDDVFTVKNIIGNNIISFEGGAFSFYNGNNQYSTLANYTTTKSNNYSLPDTSGTFILNTDTAVMLAPYQPIVIDNIDISASDYTLPSWGIFRIIVGDGAYNYSLLLPDPSLYVGKEITIINSSSDNCLFGGYTPYKIDGVSNWTVIQNDEMMIFKSIGSKWIGAKLSIN